VLTPAACWVPQYARLIPKVLQCFTVFPADCMARLLYGGCRGLQACTESPVRACVVQERSRPRCPAKQRSPARLREGDGTPAREPSARQAVLGQDSQPEACSMCPVRSAAEASERQGCPALDA
jgi:hypothetical protein